MKRALQGDMKAGKRLKLLEQLNSITDWYFTPEMLAAIEPMCDIGAAMMREAFSLDGDKGCENSFKVLTSWRVFGHFLRLNPSLMTAIKLRNEMAAAGKWLPTRQAQAI